MLPQLVSMGCHHAEGSSTSPPQTQGQGQASPGAAVVEDSDTQAPPTEPPGLSARKQAPPSVGAGGSLEEGDPQAEKMGWLGMREGPRVQRGRSRQ